MRDIIERLKPADHIVTGMKDDELFFIPMSNILYFETVDRRVFFYAEENTYEVRSTLSELEKSLSETSQRF